MDKQLDEIEGKKQSTPPENTTAATPASYVENKPTIKSYSKFDFIAGEKVLYAEDFAKDNVGELPLTWNSSGKGEVQTIEGQSGKCLHLFPNTSYLAGNRRSFGENYTAEDPNNKQYVRYTQNCERSVKEAKKSYARSTADFLRKYPDNQLLFVKMRLQEFLDATKDVDFGAETTTKSNGKKYFVTPAYERKDSRWKMAFRAGKEVIESAREFVQKWMEKIK